MARGFPARGGKVYAVFGTDMAGMAGRLLDAAGVGKAVPPGARIALKPNLVVARPAAEGATTHPEIVAGVIEYLQSHGHSDIEIIEGSWVGDDTARAFAACGMNDVGKRYGVKLYDLKKDGMVERDTPMGKVRVCGRAAEAGFLINLPVLKGHCQTRMTCALKNMKGCIPDAEKRRFHREGLDEWIAALATAIVPSLSLVDGMCGDLDFEEGGNPVAGNRMLLGADPVKLDGYVCSLMGLDAAEVGYLPLAAKYGAGELEVRDGDVAFLNRPEPGSAGKAGGKVRELGKHLDARQACSACYANAIHALMRMRERGGTQRLPGLHIGQGWRGVQAEGVGIGNCCAGKSGNVPGCPPTALDIVRTLESL